MQILSFCPDTSLLISSLLLSLMSFYLGVGSSLPRQKQGFAGTVTSQTQIRLKLAILHVIVFIYFSHYVALAQLVKLISVEALESSRVAAMKKAVRQHGCTTSLQYTSTMSQKFSYNFREHGVQQHL